MRRVLDRIAQPYVESAVRGVIESIGNDVGDASHGQSSVELHAALHEARSLALAEVPGGADIVLSAGANGLWYFEWFQQEYGAIGTHIGVEAYMHRPEGLPGNVRWVDADLASPEGVASIGGDTVDLVFSGQNVEHLWPHQMVAFFCESNRVLRNGGLLVIDSPNREFTELYRWSMGEHTVELTPPEAVRLLGLAGFSVDRMKGVWLCREAGQLLDLEPPTALIGRGGLARRMALAGSRPDDSFIWWAEARKVGPPHFEALQQEILAIFERSWPERISRVKAVDGETLTLSDGALGVLVARDTSGYAFIGPFMAVAPGTYEFTTLCRKRRTGCHPVDRQRCR
jgi:SAM-dependent methyltransferase